MTLASDTSNGRWSIKMNFTEVNLVTQMNSALPMIGSILMLFHLFNPLSHWRCFFDIEKTILMRLCLE